MTGVGQRAVQILYYGSAGAGYAGLIADRLSAQFGPEEIELDRLEEAGRPAADHAFALVLTVNFVDTAGMPSDTPREVYLCVRAGPYALLGVQNDDADLDGHVLRVSDETWHRDLERVARYVQAARGGPVTNVGNPTSAIVFGSGGLFRRIVQGNRIAVAIGLIALLGIGAVVVEGVSEKLLGQRSESAGPTLVSNEPTWAWSGSLKGTSESAIHQFDVSRQGRFRITGASAYGNVGIAIFDEEGWQRYVKGEPSAPVSVADANDSGAERITASLSRGMYVLVIGLISGAGGQYEASVRRTGR